jgi:hypothetical protein
MTEERPVLVLTPVSWGDAGIEGAVTIRADCGHQCWIAPSGMALMLAGQLAATECSVCAVENGLAQAVSIEPVPGARDELAAALGNVEADRIIAAMKTRRTQAEREPPRT